MKQEEYSAFTRNGGDLAAHTRIRMVLSRTTTQIVYGEPTCA